MTLFLNCLSISSKWECVLNNTSEAARVSNSRTSASQRGRINNMRPQHPPPSTRSGPAQHDAAINATCVKEHNFPTACPQIHKWQKLHVPLSKKTSLLQRDTESCSICTCMCGVSIATCIVWWWSVRVTVGWNMNITHDDYWKEMYVFVAMQCHSRQTAP